MYLLGVIVLFHLRRWNQLIMSDLNIVTQYIIAFPVWVTCHTGISCGDMPWQYSYMLYGTCNTMFDTVYGIWFIILFTFGYMFYILYSSLSISTKLRSCAIYFWWLTFFCSCPINVLAPRRCPPAWILTNVFQRARGATLGVFLFVHGQQRRDFLGISLTHGNGSCRGGQFFSPKGRTVELTLRELKWFV